MVIVVNNCLALKNQLPKDNIDIDLGYVVQKLPCDPAGLAQNAKHPSSPKSEKITNPHPGLVPANTKNEEYKMAIFWAILICSWFFFARVPLTLK